MSALVTSPQKQPVDLAGYSFTEKLYEGSRTVVYRGVQCSTQRPVVVKFLKEEFPSFNELIQFSNQYGIARNLNLDKIVKPVALIPYGKASALVLEDFGACDLKQFLREDVSKDTSEDASTEKISEKEEPNRKSNPSSKPSGKKVLGSSLPDLVLFFQIAIQVAEALEALFRARIIHKDIKPANILIHPKSLQVKLIDFSIASCLPKETQETQHLAALEGTLAYLSPEQTGRMNRGIDYRSDFYSFGVTCYELLTGQLPFVADDPMEIVHGHLARQPVPPSELCSGVLPDVVSDIVLKLMSKNAEDRYQSAFGLKHDLERCLGQIQESGTVKPFKLGALDVSCRFILPEKLYGRQNEVTQLLAAFDRVSKGTTELMLIAGNSGIGKTAVVNEIHKPVTRQKGYFLQGKYDQLQKSVALSAVTQAFRSLIKRLLSQSDTEIEQWRRQILQELGRNAQVIVEVIPELESIIGPQPPAPQLDAQAAEKRFHQLMQKFVQVFSNEHHPLVIFLDDLQWADTTSLKLLQYLLRDDGHLLIIGAYRDNEVNASHPLILTIEEIRSARLAKQTNLEQREEESPTLLEKQLTASRPSNGAVEETSAQQQKTKNKSHINLFTLSPLTRKDINHLVADTLHSTLSFAQPLSDFVYNKTNGNPFFSSQYLIALQAEDKITFDEVTRRWQYDLNEINAILPNSDVLEFMTGRLQKLTADVQSVLKLAACIGAEFDLSTLVIASQQPVEFVTNSLWCALQEELIVPTCPTYRAFAPGDATATLTINPTYRFFHDRIQQAAYSLIEPQQQAILHRNIGQRLLQKAPKQVKNLGKNLEERLGENLEEKLFEIVNHLNQGIALLETESDRTQLSQLNFRAGQKAKAATAYATAFEYLTTGITLLPEASWQTHYDLSLALHNEAAESAYLIGEFATMQRHVDQVIAQATTLLDKAQAYETQIQATISQNYFLQSVETALQVLAQLGIDIPKEPTPEVVQATMHSLATKLSYQPISTLIDLPEMEDPESLVVIRLLTKAVSAVYIAQPEILPLLVCTGIEQCLKFGNSPLSAFLYGWYGVLLCGPCEDIPRGCEMGELALALLEKIPSKEIQTRVVPLVHFLIHPWRAHIQESLAPLKQAHQIGLENGDTEYAGWSISVHCHYSYLSGQNLEKLSTKISRYRSVVQQLQQDAASSYLSLYEQVTLNLLGHSASPIELEGKAYSQSDSLPIHLATNDTTGLAYLYINKGILSYLFAKHKRSHKSFNNALTYVQGVTSSQWLPALVFYDSLACLATASTELMPRVVANQEKLKVWARLSPDNHLHRWQLVEAERCRCTGDKAAAMDHYDYAIDLAKANGFIQEEALASELAAQFYLLWGKGRVAQSHMLDAYYAYSRWGARAKVADLEERYALLLESTIQKKQQNLSSTDTILAYANTQSTTTSSTGISEVIDLTTLMNTSQVLSSEIELEKLLAALLEAVIQNAGADKCALIMPEQETAGEAETNSENTAQPQWVIEAFSELNGSPTLLQSIPLKNGDLLPLSLINHVRHTCKPSVIFNAAFHAELSIDPYVLKQQPKSVLCAPISNQGKLVAILYLENNLTIGAFTDSRVEVLNLICTQAAISLENARLYHKAQTALEELQTSHMQLVQSEKMSALGNLVAGVAHEINNPVNFLKGNLKPALNYVQDLLEIIDLVVDNEPREVVLEEIEDINLDFVREDLPNLLHSMTFGISRIQDISTSLRTFSRADKEYKTAFNLHEGLDSTLLILKHRLASGNHMPAIKVSKDYASLPDIHCFAGQLNQVFMNLIANAIEAIAEENERRVAAGLTAEGEANPGTITITTDQLDEQTVKVAIADNGPGMPAEVQARVFDHLFTTKAVGKGTGLGLAISHDIVTQKHGGTLTVSSKPGEGTEFVMTLPIDSNQLSND